MVRVMASWYMLLDGYLETLAHATVMASLLSGVFDGFSRHLGGKSLRSCCEYTAIELACDLVLRQHEYFGATSSSMVHVLSGCLDLRLQQSVVTAMSQSLLLRLALRSTLRTAVYGLIPPRSRIALVVASCATN
jgi:hypothetical protein